MIINNINIFEPTNIVELRDSLSALYPHNLIFNYFSTFSFSKFYIPNLYFMFICFLITFYLMHCKKLKKIYNYFEFLFVVQYLTIMHILLN